MSKRYVNKFHKSPKPGAAAEPGTVSWFKIKKSSKGTLPEIVVYRSVPAAFANHAGYAEDGEWLADPTLEQEPDADGVHTWFKVTVPSTPGVHYKICAEGPGGKPQKVLSEFDAWQRWFMNAECANGDVYNALCSAVPKVQAAFAEAGFELVWNTIKVGAEFKTFHKKDESKSSDGRVRGGVFGIFANAPKPAMKATTQELTVEFRGGAVRNWRAGKLAGKVLTVTLTGASAFAEGTICCSKLVAKRGADPLATATPEQLAAMVTWTGARTITIDFAKLPAVGDVIGASAVDIDFKFAFNVQADLTNGQMRPNSTDVDTYVTGVDELASVLCHELAHTQNGTRAKFKVLHRAPKNTFKLSEPARVPETGFKPNPFYYPSSYGGSGTHCSKGTELAKQPLKGAAGVPPFNGGFKWTLVPKAGEKICLMYHTKLVGEDGKAITDGVKFCPNCVMDVRGRGAYDAVMDPVAPLMNERIRAEGA